MTKAEIRKSAAELKEEQPKLRAVNLAEQLGISEAELVSANEKATRLTEDWEGIFKAVESLGYVMALTRNKSVVHERKGEYHNISFEGHVGLVLDPNIDLRIFQNRFGFVFAVPVESPRGTLRSIQFFDKKGKAAHKIYLMNKEHIQDYETLVQDFKHSDQESELEFHPSPSRPAHSNGNTEHEFNAEAFLSDWSELKDTHDFYPLLMKHKVERTKALEVAEGRFTLKVDNSVTEMMLNKAAEEQVSIMVFVSSGPVIQIHTGEVEKIKKMDNWLNVLDSEFNLHLREDHIAHSWVVEKPTEDGIVTSLEIFDEDRNNIATFFGARKPGKPELETWRSLIAEIREEGVLA